MDEAQTNGRLTSRWPSVGITSILAASACIFLGFRIVLALGGEDVDKYESPLMLSVARQLVTGPWELYGPFGGSNPLVLIHAPLYYRAAGLAAWPMARAGLHPVEAARRAGRLISVIGLAATAMAAYRLGRLGGLPRRAGWWSALLVASSSVLAGQPFAVRPDMVGVALQSWAIVLVLEGLRGGGRRLGVASSLFGLAVCVKQHLVGAWAVSTGLALLAWLRGRAGLGAVARVVLPGAAVALAIYGAEWVVTGGRIWDAAFVAAANVGRVHPGSWDRAFIVSIAIGNRSAGVVALLAAAAFTAAGSRPGVIRRLSTAVGIVAIGVVLGALVVQIRSHDPMAGVATFLLVILAALLALPAATLCVRDSAPAIGIDAALWVYLAVELVLAMLLARASTGAWLNYAIPATVLASALAGRGLGRALHTRTPPWLAVPAALASLAVLASSIYGIREVQQQDRFERLIVEQFYERLKRPRSSYFFTDRPGINRVNGRLELVHDDWLYPVFESLRLAEPRSRWLGTAIVSGPVRAVVATNDRSLIEGTTLDLRRLGFHSDASLGPFYVWTR
jgi:hypothetical protein